MPGSAQPQARLIIEKGDTQIVILGELRSLTLERYMPGRVFHGYSFSGGRPRVTGPLLNENAAALTNEDTVALENESP